LDQSKPGAYFIDASILPAISTRCAVAKAICAVADWFSSDAADQLFSAILSRKAPTGGESAGWPRTLDPYVFHRNLDQPLQGIRSRFYTTSMEAGQRRTRTYSTREHMVLGDPDSRRPFQICGQTFA